MTRPIFFLTDFGLADTYVGVVKAVILGIAPDARIVDLTHDVPPQDVRAGAFALLTATPYLPADAVVLAVVDPGVGTARRPIAVQVDGRTFVGPDNGLLSWAIREDVVNLILTSDPTTGAATDNPNLPRPPQPTDATDNPNPLRLLSLSSQERGSEGGVFSTVVLDRPRFWLPTVSATFHGRDLFGPVAAHLARGVPLAEVGSTCNDLQALPFPPVRRTLGADRRLVAAHGEIVHVDRFGNLISNLAAIDLPAAPTIDVAGHTIVGLSPHFQAGAPGSPIALIGSAGLLEVAVPNGSAAALLGIGAEASLSVASRPRSDVAARGLARRRGGHVARDERA